MVSIMGKFIGSLVFFEIILCILRILQIFRITSSAGQKIMNMVLLVVLLIMAFVQSYIKALYQLSESSVTRVYFVAIILFGIVEVTCNLIKHRGES